MWTLSYELKLTFNLLFVTFWSNLVKELSAIGRFMVSMEDYIPLETSFLWQTSVGCYKRDTRTPLEGPYTFYGQIQLLPVDNRDCLQGDMAI